MLRKFFRRRPRLSASSSTSERAGELFDQGLNCAQAVLQATTGIDDPKMMAVCDAFGGGIGDSKCLCGAVSGGVMALGLSGRGRQAAKLVAAFKQKHRTTCCKGLSAPFEWMSRQHLANCRKITTETAAEVARLLKKP